MQREQLIELEDQNQSLKRLHKIVAFPNKRLETGARSPSPALSVGEQQHRENQRNYAKRLNDGRAD